MPITITESEIREAINAAYAVAGAKDGFTSRELGKTLGLRSERAISRRINDALDCGLIEPVALRRPYRDGRLSWVSGYRLIGS